MRVAVYPGSFDPFTNGHLDILGGSPGCSIRSLSGFWCIPPRTACFPEKRVAMIIEVCKDLKNVRAIHFDGLLVDFCRKVGACAVIRGLRAVSDYEYELQMFSVNKQLAPIWKPSS